MYVIKRDGTREPVAFDKVQERIRRAAAGLGPAVDVTRLAQLVVGEIHDGVRTTELDELAARIAVSYMTVHPDWGTLAAQIIVSNCQRSAPATFAEAMEALGSSTIATDVLAFIRANKDALNAMVRPEHDFLLDYFGFKTLEKAYLLRASQTRRIVETPQYMWLRVSVGIWSGAEAKGEDVMANIQDTYTLMSTKAFTHATPTLFNAGTPRPQLSSCYLQAMKSDSIEGIFDTLKDCALISKYAGGIGLHVHNIRAQGTPIVGTQGTSNGLVPMLRVFNNTARYVDQGGGRRNGSFAIYLEPWHADIQAFLKMKSNTGSEEERARDLFYALWIPDLFMRRVEAGGDWSLFCPHEAPGLADVHGAAFEELYTRYETEGKARRTVPAQKLWSEILVSQIETGTPYLLYKDAANAKSNQQNLGTIKSSNLCVAPETHITIYDPTEIGDWRGGFTVPPRGRSVSIADVAGHRVMVWNGTGFSFVTPTQTSANEPLLHVTVVQQVQRRDGRPGRTERIHLDCTRAHKFILPGSGLIDAPRIPAAELVAGQQLYTWTDECGDRVVQTVYSVEDRGRSDDTYCYTEPVNHFGVFNGIGTGQCTEIIEYSSPEETAVCNLASIVLPYFIKSGSDKTSGKSGPSFDFDTLRSVTAKIVRNLNRVIDINFYPTPETRLSNLRHRPIGLGVQGLADVFADLGLAWESPEAAALNQTIFEHIYYAAVDASVRIAERDGPYETFKGSPASEGRLQPDLWNLDPAAYKTAATLDWAGLKARVIKHGLRNSLLLAPMPTASTSQVMGYTECIEPITSNIYVRRTLAGEFTMVNRHLVRDLMALGLWTPTIKERIVAANGSVQNIAEVPAELKARYKTVWEIKQKTLIDMAADRGAFICQSQSLNLFVQDPTIAKLSSMHFYGWRRGLKTGIYYLRTKSAVQAIKFTVDPGLLKRDQLTGQPAGTDPTLLRAATLPAEKAEDKECLLCSS